MQYMKQRSSRRSQTRTPGHWMAHCKCHHQSPYRNINHRYLRQIRKTCWSGFCSMDKTRLIQMRMQCRNRWFPKSERFRLHRLHRDRDQPHCPRRISIGFRFRSNQMLPCLQNGRMFVVGLSSGWHWLRSIHLNFFEICPLECQL